MAEKELQMENIILSSQGKEEMATELKQVSELQKHSSIKSTAVDCILQQ
jgi:hypothetical protein